MPTRMTGITGIIDIDALVEANLIRQKTKINSATQNLKIEQYKQEQYRTLMTQAKSFYNNYFDILGSNSLSSTSAYNIMKAKSSDANTVTATASTKAKTANYEVTVSSKATAAKYQLKADDLKDITNITVNNVNVDLSSTATGVNITGSENSSELKEKLKQKAEYLNTKLKDAGVTAQYSDFVDNGNGGLVIETKATGSDAELSIFTGSNPLNTIGVNAATYAKTETKRVNDLLGAIDSGDIKNFTVMGNNLTISDDDFDTIKSLKEEYDNDNSDENIKKLTKSLADAMNNAIIKASESQEDSNKLSNKVKAVYSETDGTIGFESKIIGSGVSLGECKIAGGAELSEVAGTSAQTSLSVEDILTDTNKDLIINGQTVKFTRDSDEAVGIANLNNALSQYGLKYDGGIISSIDSSAVTNFKCSIRDNTGMKAIEAGSNAEVSIRNKDTGLTYTHTGNSNQITLDEVTFNILDAPSDGSTVTINVKPDGTELKDKIVDFINDYNSLLGAINTKLYEEYDRSYKPLTDEDKEGLTDQQIEKLEEKAKTGLLRNDDYLVDFADQMKNAMSSIMKGTGLNLERIGITPVKDYSSQNGIFEIDEDKLLAAIEENPDGIKELFLKGIANDTVSSDDGIMAKMTDILKKQVVNFDSIFARKAGFATGTYATINEMTLDIKDRQKKIEEMESAYTTKEDLLYSKYSKLESSLAELQSQQSSLASYLG